MQTPETIDVVIPFGRAYIPENQNFVLPDEGELMYCLRSIQKHLTGVRNIYIIGTHMPGWFNKHAKGVIHIPFPPGKQGPNNASFNIFTKLVFACKLRTVSDNFLYMNDDHFLLRDFDAVDFPYFYEGMFGPRSEPGAKITSYRRTMDNTIAAIGEKAKYFDVHAPIRFNKNEFLKLEHYNFSINGGMCIKSVYCHQAKHTGTKCIDLKIPSMQSTEWIEKNFAFKEFFSTHDNCFGKSMINKMNELYPEKSKFEL